MNGGDYTYIWQASDWPRWHYDLASLAGPLADVSRAQGLLLGRLSDVGMALRDQASLAALTEDVIKTSEIEGERLDAESVRSSIARRLGVDIGALAPVDRPIEGVVEMVLDATLVARLLSPTSGCLAGTQHSSRRVTVDLPRSRSANFAVTPVAPCGWCPVPSDGSAPTLRLHLPIGW